MKFSNLNIFEAYNEHLKGRKDVGHNGGHSALLDKNLAVYEEDKYEELIHMQKDKVQHSFGPIEGNYNDLIFPVIKDYLDLKYQKNSLNSLLSEKMNETKEAIDIYISKNKHSLYIYRQSEVFKPVSFILLKRVLGSMAKINSLPFYTKVKILKEINTIDKRAKNSAVSLSFILTPLISLAITRFTYSTFSSLIRHKKRFFINYLSKVFLVTGVSSYLAIKNICLLYYMRQPLIDTNELFAENEYEKENSNIPVKRIRQKLGDFGIINDINEYSIFMKSVYEDYDRDKLSKKLPSKPKVKVLPHFYFLSYKYLLLLLKFNLFTEVHIMKEYFYTLNAIYTQFKVNLMQKIYLNHYLEENIDKVIKEYEKSFLISTKKESKSKLKLKFTKKKKKKMKSLESKFSKQLNEVRRNNMKLSSKDEQIQLMKTMIYLEVIKKKSLDPLLYSKFEIKRHFKEIKEKSVEQWLINCETFYSVISDEKEMKNFIKFLSSQPKKEKYMMFSNLPKEFILPHEISYIEEKYNLTYNPSILTQFLQMNILTFFLQVLYLKIYSII